MMIPCQHIGNELYQHIGIELYQHIGIEGTWLNSSEINSGGGGGGRCVYKSLSGQ
jgi:hypothetical protein